MDLFGQLVRTVVNVASLPVAALGDTVNLMNDAADGEPLAPRTRKAFERLKREASERTERR